MRIMAIRASHGPFIDAVLVGHFKLGTNIRMTSVAKLGLYLCQQLNGCGRFVNGVTFGTHHTVIGVGRSLDVEARRIGGVTAQTSGHSLFRRHL